LQAIFYRRPEARLLGDEAGFAAMCAHLARVAGIARELGAPALVFGAPANRRREGLAMAPALALAVGRLRRIGDLIAPLRLAVEPVPAAAGCDFLTRGAEVLALVRAVDHPAIGMQLDSAAAEAAGEDGGALAQAAGAALVHVHAAQPALGDFSAPIAAHGALAAGLAARGWDGWVSVEMLAGEDESDEMARLAAAVAAVGAIYRISSPSPAASPRSMPDRSAG
jgi:sugar phosphate isomerase/epimerase